MTRTPDHVTPYLPSSAKLPAGGGGPGEGAADHQHLRYHQGGRDQGQARGPGHPAHQAEEPQGQQQGVEGRLERWVKIN